MDIQSLVNGRPPALNIKYTDCRFPDDLDPSVKPSGDTDLGCKCPPKKKLIRKVLNDWVARACVEVPLLRELLVDISPACIQYQSRPVRVTSRIRQEDP